MFDKTILYFLVMAIAIVPISSAFAAVKTCSATGDMSHHEMSDSGEHKKIVTKAINLTSSADLIDSSNSEDCCEENSCTFAHCAILVLVITPTIITSYNEIIESKILAIDNKSFNNHLTSAIFRPPKS